MPRATHAHTRRHLKVQAVIRRCGTRLPGRLCLGFGPPWGPIFRPLSSNTTRRGNLKCFPKVLDKYAHCAMDGPRFLD
jgi:hypothetical protein